MVCVQFIRWGFGQSIGSELMIAMMLMMMVANTWDRRDTCHTPSLHNAPSDKVSHLRSSWSSEACALTYLSLSPYIGKMICFSLPKLICELPSNILWKLFCREIFCPYRSKQGCLHYNPPNPSFGWITKKRSFSSELKSALKGWGERGQSIFFYLQNMFCWQVRLLLSIFDHHPYSSSTTKNNELPER